MPSKKELRAQAAAADAAKAAAKGGDEQPAAAAKAEPKTNGVEAKADDAEVKAEDAEQTGDDAQHERTFEQASAGASLTYPMQCSALRKNGHIVIKGFPCKVIFSLFVS